MRNLIARFFEPAFLFLGLYRRKPPVHWTASRPEWSRVPPMARTPKTRTTVGSARRTGCGESGAAPSGWRCTASTWALASSTGWWCGDGLRGVGRGGLSGPTLTARLPTV